MSLHSPREGSTSRTNLPGISIAAWQLLEYAQRDHAEHQEERRRAGARARWSGAEHCRRAQARPTSYLSTPALFLSGDHWTG
eukprot:4502023-Prymnesium_polylepis.1